MHKYFEIEVHPERLYAIGDIHACPDELKVLLDFLENEEGIKAPRDQVIFIGDYIDRGPDSKAVIDLLIDFQKRFNNTIFLKGNHEDMLLGFLGYGGTLGDSYLQNGGVEFLASYGLKPEMGADAIGRGIPSAHLSFYLGLEGYVITPDFIFVHAGLNPLRDLKSQLNEDLFWIRDPFINNVHNFDRTVIFGHTPYENLLFHVPFKIGIDTGLVFGNMLTCVELLSQRALQVSRGAKKVRVTDFKNLM